MIIKFCGYRSPFHYIPNFSNVKLVLMINLQQDDRKVEHFAFNMFYYAVSKNIYHTYDYAEYNYGISDYKRAIHYITPRNLYLKML